MAIDQANVDEFLGRFVAEFLGRFVADLGAMFSVLNVVVGDKLGRYKVPAAAGPLTAAELAERTHTSERYGARWLAGQAARRLCHLRPGRRVLPAHRGAGVRVGRREQPRLPARRLPARHLGRHRRAVGRRRVPDRCRTRLVRAPRRPLARHRALLAARLRGQPGRVLDPGAGGGGGPAGRLGPVQVLGSRAWPWPALRTLGAMTHQAWLAMLGVSSDAEFLALDPDQLPDHSDAAWADLERQLDIDRG